MARDKFASEMRGSGEPAYKCFPDRQPMPYTPDHNMRFILPEAEKAIPPIIKEHVKLMFRIYDHKKIPLWFERISDADFVLKPDILWGSLMDMADLPKWEFHYIMDETDPKGWTTKLIKEGTSTATVQFGEFQTRVRQIMDVKA